MNCREFENRWNELLDNRAEGLPVLEAGLEIHVSTCDRCQSISTRYQLLRQALSTLPQQPLPSANSRERLRRLSVPAEPERVVGRWVRFVIPLATAATLLALAGYFGPWRPDRPIAQMDLTPPIAQNAAPRPIETALEAATSATFNLAREASAPATRIGRDVFRRADEPTSDSTPIPVLEDEVALVETSDLLQAVGERVNAGVKPISGSARHAFSFLLGPPSGQDRQSPPPGDLTR